MKTKLVLFLLAAIGATALAAFAQTPTPAYVITATRDGQSQDVVTRVSAPPPPPAGPLLAPTAPGAPMRDAIYGPQHINLWVQGDGLSHQAEQLAQQLAAARSDSDRDKLKGQLAEVLEKQFDQRQKRHEEEIKQLEAQIKKLKDLVDKRQENRREIIARRFDQIVKESQGLGW